VIYDVQALVDDLSVRLSRPVGVDDRRFRAVAYSSHAENVDAVRLSSILRRQAPAAVREWLASLDVEGADRYVRVPANGSLQMLERVCVPIRFDHSLLGYLWLIDEPSSLTEAEIEEASACAEELAAELYRMTRLEDSDRERTQELLRTLLGIRPGVPEEAGEELLSHSLLALGSSYVVLALAPDHSAGDAAPEALRVRLTVAMEQLGRVFAPRHLRVLVDGEWVIAVVALGAGDDLRAHAATLTGAGVGRSLETTAHWTTTVGVGAPRLKLAELSGSYAEAGRSIALGRSVPGLGPLVVWSDLGAYRTLALMMDSDVDEVPVAESFTRLVTSGDASALVPTLEQYLDHAGDARLTADAMFLHKSSLYGRLRRIEEVAGVDLSSGDDRLELHLALRLWRMRGGDCA
jgi:hypothetical protein